MEIKDNPIKITTTLKVVITGEFYDDEASEETLRYFVEQDLEDDGFDVDVELLKEQEAVEPNISHDCWWFQCSKCKTQIDYGDRFCRQCGQAAKWK